MFPLFADLIIFSDWLALRDKIMAFILIGRCPVKSLRMQKFSIMLQQLVK